MLSFNSTFTSFLLRPGRSARMMSLLSRWYISICGDQVSRGDEIDRVKTLRVDIDGMQQARALFIVYENFSQRVCARRSGTRLAWLLERTVWSNGHKACEPTVDLRGVDWRSWTLTGNQPTNEKRRESLCRLHRICRR